MPPRWPNGARAAICQTLDNMGEAADLNRGLWPSDSPIGSHYSVTKVIPQILDLLDKYDIKATYFTESWNVDVYPETLEELVKRGHEVGWHAFQHEAWAKLSPSDEKDNFSRSFQEIQKLQKTVPKYSGFRPPGGIINNQTLSLCQQHGIKYLSPAATEAAIVPTTTSSPNPTITDPKDLPSESSIVILPFKWSTVDAYYYMTSFSGLRKMKGETSPSEPLSPETLLSRYKGEIDTTISKGGFLSLLFHPFLTDMKERLDVVEEVFKYLAEKRDKGEIWLARCGEVEEWIRNNPGTVEGDPGWDMTSWR